MAGILISLTHTNVNKCIPLHYQDSSRKEEQDVHTKMFLFQVFIIKVEFLMLYRLEKIAVL